MKNKFFYGTLFVSVFVLVINIALLPILPEKVPMQWSFDGEVNRYGSKYEQLAVGAMPLLIFLLLNYVPRIDPKKLSYQKHSKPYAIMNFLIILFLSGMNLVALSSALGYEMKFSVIVPISVGILFMGIGNYITQLRPNYTVGFRTPWALASENVWRKTHRFGGYIFMVIGILAFPLIFLGERAMLFLIAAILLGVLSIYTYSYLAFKKHE